MSAIHQEFEICVKKELFTLAQQGQSIEVAGFLELGQSNIKGSCG
jgi:hypothetical protein